MKKILSLLSLFLVLISCSTESDGPKIHYELIPIQNVTMPDIFYIGEQNEILIEYKKPTTCHGFDGFYYEKNDMIRTVAVQNYVVEQDNCQNLTNEVKEETLKFNPNTIGTYTFKFWQGKDSNGNDIFLEIQREAVLE